MKLGKYKHFKGNFYVVIGVARSSETLEEFVIYKALYDHPKYGKDSLWVRPKQMFEETIERNGVQVKRFSYIKHT